MSKPLFSVRPLAKASTALSLHTNLPGFNTKVLMPLSLSLALALTCGRKTEKIGGGKSESERKVKCGVQSGENSSTLHFESALPAAVCEDRYTRLGVSRTSIVICVAHINQAVLAGRLAGIMIRSGLSRRFSDHRLTKFSCRLRQAASRCAAQSTAKRPSIPPSFAY